MKRKTRAHRETSTKLNYRDCSSESESDEEDVLDTSDEENSSEMLEYEEFFNKTETEQPVNNSDTIERVLKHRDGVPGAVGPSTTWYNIKERGDPNVTANDICSSDLERQYFIKWVGWSHLHNTWESEKSLSNNNARGLKKLENYIRKENEMETW